MGNNQWNFNQLIIIFDSIEILFYKKFLVHRNSSLKVYFDFLEIHFISGCLWFKNFCFKNEMKNDSRRIKVFSLMNVSLV
ncbi:hypothetical protein LEP1GSC041_1573 [Leptospira noguchii str. 2006001870]|nr:hypothetical protein LEP1GSC041_1573 [Leptospira noguchii str. 2006001870]